MKKQIAGALVVATLGGGALLAAGTAEAEAGWWVDATDPSSVRVDSLTFYSLPDGGIRGQITAHGLKADGGIGRQGSVTRDLTGQARTDILQFINNRALPLWITEQAAQ